MELYHKPIDSQRYLPFTPSHPNLCKRNVSFYLAQRICTIAENNGEKLENLENLKSNLSKYNYPDLLVKQGFRLFKTRSWYSSYSFSQVNTSSQDEKNHTLIFLYTKIKHVLDFCKTCS